MSNNIVFIVNIKEEGDRKDRSIPYHYSINSWAKWCKKNNHELFILEERIYPKEVMNANWHKLFAFDLLEANEIPYDQILIVDADTIIHPNSPDIFSLSDNKFCAIRNVGSMDWVCRSYENYKKNLFPHIEYSPLDYFNSGVLLMNKTHKKTYTKLIQFYLECYENNNIIQNIQKTYGVGTDQPVINFFLRQENVDIKFLPYEWNMQDLNRFEILDDNLTFTNRGWLYHFNAIPNNHDGRYTQYFMEKTYKTLYN